MVRQRGELEMERVGGLKRYDLVVAALVGLRQGSGEQCQAEDLRTPVMVAVVDWEARDR